MRHTSEKYGLGDEAGQVTPLMAGFLVMVGVAMLLIIGVTELVVDRTHAQTAADAAALAGVIDGRPAAAALARANGAELIGFSERNDDVQVEVRVGIMTATATARAEPGQGDRRSVGQTSARTSHGRSP